MYITLNNCGKNYHRTWLFQGINLTIPVLSENQAPLKLAILGANGAGKSTFTLMLAGQTDPTEGRITWHDANRKSLPQTVWHKHISLASPGMELPEEFTLAEWFEFHQQIKGFQKSVSLTSILELCGFAKSTVSKQLLTFSSGMKQRVKLCSALLGNQSLVILDEPLTNLDTAGSELYKTLIEKHLGQRGLIIASNRDDEWVNYCTHRYTIGDSELKAV
ncbi:MAG: ATP-binding cassette domain-containing protein [Bacteroidota bacterium]